MYKIIENNKSSYIKTDNNLNAITNRICRVNDKNENRTSALHQSGEENHNKE